MNKSESVKSSAEYKMAYTRKFLLTLESVCDVDPVGNVVIPYAKAHTFYEELRKCQEMMAHD